MAHTQPLRDRFAFPCPGAESSRLRYTPDSLFCRRLKYATTREVGRAWLLASIFMPMYKHLSGIVAHCRRRAVMVVFPAPSGPINATLNIGLSFASFRLFSGKCTRSRRKTMVFRRAAGFRFHRRRAQFSGCERLCNRLKQMFLQQDLQAHFDSPNVCVMAKTGFESCRNSRLLQINLPRVEIRDNGLAVVLFKSSKDPCRE